MFRFVNFTLFILLSTICFSQKIDSLKVKTEVDSLIKLGKKYQLQGDYDNTVHHISEALDHCGNTMGEKSAYFAFVEKVLGDVYMRMEEFDKAEDLFNDAMRIREAQANIETLEYGQLLGSYAYLNTKTGNYKTAEEFYKKALPVLEKNVGNKDSKYARCLNRYGIMYFNLEKYEKAKPLWEEATEIWKTVHGEKSREYCSGLHNMGNLNKRLSKYEKAAELYAIVRDIKKETTSENDPQYALSLLALATIYTDLDRNVEAEPLFTQALDIFEKSLGPKHSYSIDTKNAVAVFYGTIRKFGKAIKIMEEVVAVQDTVFGKDNLRYTEFLTNLAAHQSNIGNKSLAIEYLKEAQEIQDTIFDGIAMEAHTMMTLGSVYREDNQLEMAEKTFFKIKQNFEEAKQDSIRSYASCISQLAELYYSSGRRALALPLLTKAKEILIASTGKNTSEYARTLNRLAILHADIGEDEKSEPYFELANQIDKRFLIDATKYLSERDLGRYITQFKLNQDKYLSVAQSQKQYASTAFNNALFYKGFLQNGALHFNRLAQKDSTSSIQFLLLKSYKRRLAAEYSKPLKERSDIEELEEKTNALEIELTKKIVGLHLTTKQIKWPEVQNTLKPNSAAIEFVRYQENNYKATDNIMYAAFILRSDSEEIQYIPLFEEKELSSLFIKEGGDYSSFVNQMYDSDPISSSNKSLSQLVYHPLKEALSGIQTIYYSPTGLLHRLNLDAIKLKNNDLLGNIYTLNRLGSTRQLVLNLEEQNLSNNRAQLFGDIQYDFAETDSIVLHTEINDPPINLSNENGSSLEELELTNNRGVSIVYKLNTSDSTFINKGWEALNWTGVELETIQIIMEDYGINLIKHTGINASEEMFKQIGTKSSSPKIIHVATHGFFFEDPKTKYSNASSFGQELSVFKVSDNPMIRSGLILSQANYAWEKGYPIKPHLEDGILTAYEIAQMNLAETELVVLSACETGLGDIQGNEGVYGLQRAFKIAGAKYLIMSLWQVPDFQTQALMTSFYYHWLEEKMDIPEAFRAAQKELRTEYPDPISWAGFVLIE